MNNLLEKQEYLDDKLKFLYVDLNRKLKNAQVYTDDSTYAVVQGTPEVPVWVWTLDGLSKDKLLEVKDALTKLLVSDKLEVTSRESVYNYLVENNYEYLDRDSYFELGFLDCNEVVKPRECDGYLDRVKENELELLAELVYLEKKELPLDSLTREESYEKAKEFLVDDTFYVWRNKEGKVVAFLNYRVYDDVAKLGNVYTACEERRKGYCSNLVYEVTKKLLDKGLKVMLYTDYRYPNSNGAYKKVGFVDKGYLVNYTLRRK